MPTAAAPLAFRPNDTRVLVACCRCTMQSTLLLFLVGAASSLPFHYLVVCVRLRGAPAATRGCPAELTTPNSPTLRVEPTDEVAVAMLATRTSSSPLVLATCPDCESPPPSVSSVFHTLAGRSFIHRDRARPPISTCCRAAAASSWLACSSATSCNAQRAVSAVAMGCSQRLQAD